MTETEAWITAPGTIDPQELGYCVIRHFPHCGDHFRASLVELPEGSGGPVILHRYSAELVYVVDGNVLAFVDGKVRQLAAGTTVFLPPNTAHGFKPSGGTARLFVVHSPAVSAQADHERVAEDFDLGGIIS